MTTAAIPIRPAVEEAPRGRRSFDPFRILSADERREQLEAYMGLLVERDGDLDFGKGTLSRREEFFAELAEHPVRRTGAIDEDAFRQHYFRTGKPSLDERTLWMLAVCRTNEGENFGAQKEYELYKRRGFRNAAPQQLYILGEERYHCRMLIEACRTLGVDIDLGRPPLVMRALIYGMCHLPNRLRYIPVIGGEALSCVVFRLLLDHSGLFPDEPEVEERVQLLLGEIVKDEVFHLVYCRARIGRWAIRFARALLPVVVLGLVRGVPQLRELGITRKVVMDRIRQGIEFPSEMDWTVPERSNA